ncbi:MAG: acyltransferase [Pseudomonadota bacterium]
MIRKFKAPQMVYGYRDASGDWRERTRISDTVYFNHSHNVFIGDNSYIGHFTILDGTEKLTIEEGVQLAGWNGIYTHSSHIAIRLYGKHYQDIYEDDKKGYIANPVNICRYAFVGAGAIILPGVSVGQGALVAAGAIIKSDVDDFQIVSGNPAMVVGDTRELDKRYLNDPIIKSWYEEWQKI